MPNLLVAGNSTNGGTAITTDTSGTLNIVTGSGSGSNAITIDASQAVIMPGTLAVTGAQTVGGNLTVSGTLTASGGVSGSIRSGTAVASTSGTSIDFTGIPSGVKRITVMFNGVSTNGTSLSQVQIGSGSVTTSGYSSTASYSVSASNFAYVSTGFVLNTTGTSAAAVNFSGILQICLISSNVWVASGNCGGNATNQVTNSLAGISPTLSGNLDRVRITTVNGTDTFDAGSINILFE